MRNTMRCLTAAMLLFGCLLMAGCNGNDPVATPPPDTSTECGGATTQAASSVSSVNLNGPIEVRSKAITWNLNRIGPKQWSDAVVGEIRNTGSSVVTVDEVVLAAECDASELRFDGAFVAPAGNYDLVSRAGSIQELTSLNGYQLAPITQTSGRAPMLVIRIGPALAADTEGFDVSRNNNVNLRYTVDGEQYIAVYPIRFEYPN